MLFRRCTPCVLLVATIAGCGGGNAPAALDTDNQKASYAIGLDMGSRLEAAAEHIDLPALMKGVEDALAGSDPAVEEAELREVMAQFNQTVREAQESAHAAAAEENLAEEEAYLAEHGAKEGVVTTESGLQYEVIEAGDGPRPTADDQVRLHYRGTFADGDEFDSSYGGDPAVFSVGGLIPGFTEALLLMNVGSHYRIVVPSQIAYGPQGSRSMEPNKMLIFEIELLGIE